MSKLFNRPARWVAVAGFVVGSAVLIAAEEKAGPQQPWSDWRVHDMKRPAPPVVTPGTPSTPEAPGKAPSDAIILFDGTNLDQWIKSGKKEGSRTAEPAPWKLENGYMVADKSYIATKQEFGDVQLHVEWAEPTPVSGDSQGRGNSGVFLMGLFECQVLDSYNNPSYPDGQCAAVYGQYPPQVNACKPPGEWQTYDIIFHHPRYKDGKMTEPANITTIQNGVLCQDHQRIEGPTGHMRVAKYGDEILEKGPIALQFHGNPIRYRNIWVRPLEALDQFQHTGKEANAPASK